MISLTLKENESSFYGEFYNQQEDKTYTLFSVCKERGLVTDFVHGRRGRPTCYYALEVQGVKVDEDILVLTDYLGNDIEIGKVKSMSPSWAANANSTLRRIADLMHQGKGIEKDYCLEDGKFVTAPPAKVFQVNDDGTVEPSPCTLDEFFDQLSKEVSGGELPFPKPRKSYEIERNFRPPKSDFRDRRNPKRGRGRRG